jgi:hypothetical protein
MIINGNFLARNHTQQENLGCPEKFEAEADVHYNHG